MVDLPVGVTEDNGDNTYLPPGVTEDNTGYDGTDNSPYGTKDPNSTHAAINNFLYRLPGELGKGIPVAGNYIPQPKGQDQYEANNPWTTRIERGVGTVASMAPLSAVALAPELGLGANALIQGSMWGGMGTADMATKAQSQGGEEALSKLSNSDYAKTFGADALMGALGPLAGKVISPFAKAAPKPYKIPELPKTEFSDGGVVSDARQEYIRKMMGQPTESSNRLIEKGVDSGNQAEHAAWIDAMRKSKGVGDFADLGGAAVGGILSGGSLEAMVLGLLAGPSVKKFVGDKAGDAIRKGITNQIMADPKKKAILNALSAGTGNAYTSRDDSISPDMYDQ